MHELSLARALYNEVARLAAEQRGRVVRVRVQAGPLCGVEPLLLAGAFETLLCDAGRDPALDGAKLDVELVPLVLRCETCGATVEEFEARFICPGCGGRRLSVVSGEGLVLSELVVEEPQPLTGAPSRNERDA